MHIKGWHALCEPQRHKQARLTFLFKTDPRSILWDTKNMSWNKISYILAIKTNTYSAEIFREYPFEKDT